MHPSSSVILFIFGQKHLTLLAPLPTALSLRVDCSMQSSTDFVIHQVDPTLLSKGARAGSAAILMTCQACRARSTVTIGGGLQTDNAGVWVTCPGCNANAMLGLEEIWRLWSSDAGIAFAAAFDASIKAPVRVMPEGDRRRGPDLSPSGCCNGCS